MPKPILTPVEWDELHSVGNECMHAVQPLVREETDKSTTNKEICGSFFFFELEKYVILAASWEADEEKYLHNVGPV